MKTIYIILFLFSGIAFSVYGQTIDYSYAYDAAGNRYERAIISIKSADGESFLEKENLNLEALENLEDYIGEQNLKIYPNPTRGEMALEFVNFPEDKSLNLSLLDNSGKTVLKEKVQDSLYVLDINHFPAGNYLLRLELDNVHKVYQIVKQ